MCDEDGKEEMFKEMIEMDDEKMVVMINGFEGYVMEELKVYVVIFYFIFVFEEGCICKVIMVWEKWNEDFFEFINYMKFVEMMVVDMDDYIF